MHEEDFTKEDSSYVLSKQLSKAELAKQLKVCISEAMRVFVVPASMSYDKFIIIGSCYPKDNLLLEHKKQSYIPHKIEMLMSKKPNIKWLLRENDIHIDIECINEICIGIFNEMFNKPKNILKLLGNDYTNVVFVSHNRLDCYMLFKAIKWIYGSSNCKNIWKDKLMSTYKSNMIALNDVIHKYVHNKNELNKSRQLKEYANEVKCYLKEKLGV